MLAKVIWNGWAFYINKWGYNKRIIPYIMNLGGSTRCVAWHMQEGLIVPSLLTPQILYRRVSTTTIFSLSKMKYWPFQRITTHWENFRYTQVKMEEDTVKNTIDEHRSGYIRTQKLKELLRDIFGRDIEVYVSILLMAIFRSDKVYLVYQRSIVVLRT